MAKTLGDATVPITAEDNSQTLVGDAEKNLQSAAGAARADERTKFGGVGPQPLRTFLTSYFWPICRPKLFAKLPRWRRVL